MKIKEMKRTLGLVFLLTVLLGMSGCGGPELYEVEYIMVEFELEPGSPLIGDKAYILDSYTDESLGGDTGIFILQEKNRLNWQPYDADFERQGMSEFGAYTFYLRIGEENQWDEEKQNEITMLVSPNEDNEYGHHGQFVLLESDHGVIEAAVTIFYSGDSVGW